MKRCAALAAGTLLCAAAAAQGATYTIDPTHTFVTFEATAGLSTLRGRLDRKQGTITLDRNARSGRAEITLDTTSVSTGIAAIDTPLKGAEVLDTAAHPSAKFVAERFAFAADGKVQAIDGELAWRGVTHPLVLRAAAFNCYQNLLLRREVCGGDFEATITRADFRLGAGLPALGDTFRLLIQVEAIRQEAP